MLGAEGCICNWWVDTKVQPESLILFRYRPHWALWPNPDSDPSGKEFEHEIPSHTTELDQQVAELEWQEQQLLLQYETEMLGLEVMQQFRRIAELEWEEQQPLMQYETELLGLDVMEQCYQIFN
ncbi:uncharacterized protein PV07_04569 [Cladophialophora immunda]|uniref:Uncharacterized protein n=1 Tax=Cladophialophora immunda TaxID=569365 RepID=A0A0D2DBK0_9EURO|nr:uncharacterized protein PV07_04569 [Cladophialophora immunda]KIW33074.1 hypothetical protein PV07_04569 [Cladophialophora immunda]